MLDDVAFIASVSEDLAREYRTAKRYVQDVPTQALLHVRSFAHKLTELLAAPAKLSFDSPNLYDRIEQLNRQRLIDVRITRALHRLRPMQPRRPSGKVSPYRNSVAGAGQKGHRRSVETYGTGLPQAEGPGSA